MPGMETLAEWKLPECFSGDFPSWAAVVFAVVATVIAYKAFRRPLSQMIFDHKLQWEHDAASGNVTVTAKAVIVSLATSFIWKSLSCRVTFGDQIVQLDLVSVNAHLVLGHTYVLIFHGNANIPSSVTELRVDIAVDLYDGAKRQQTWVVFLESNRSIVVRKLNWILRLLNKWR